MIILPSSLSKRLLYMMLTASIASLAVVLICGIARAKESILTSPHNLSASGKYDIRFPEELRVCIFCHAPHNARLTGEQNGIPAPLWNRDMPADSNYTPYGVGSTTLKAGVSSVPTGSSRLCLSCHDGTIALNSYGNPYIGKKYMEDGELKTIAPPAPVYLSAVRPSNLSHGPDLLKKDLSDDHPISFLYDEGLVGLKRGELASPSSLVSSHPEMHLDQDGSLQCTTCHDPHNNEYGKFMVMSNSEPGSPFCTACHTYETTFDGKSSWSGSPHFSATIGSGPTATTGCMNCHTPHNAPQPQRLLRYAKEGDNCVTSCHNTGLKDLAPTNPVTPFAQQYHHPMDEGAHDEGEPLPVDPNLTGGNYHVECVDCHNPHRTVASLSVAPPTLDGPLYGVRINNQGDVATKEFDICYKCHAGIRASLFTAANSQYRTVSAPITRRSTNLDESERFNTGNPSIHPVTAARTTTKGALSLDLTSTSIMYNRLGNQIYCSDCHGSDNSPKAATGKTGANGPHGSKWEHILVAQYDTPSLLQTGKTPPFTYPLWPGSDTTLYALCYRCHLRSVVMGAGSGFGNNGHSNHVVDRGIPCFVCHDPHGTPLNITSGVPATFVNNANAHLINFNTGYTGLVPLPEYSTTTPGIGGSGSCTVSCHSTGTGTGGTTHTYP